MVLVGTRDLLFFGHCEIVESHWQLHSTAMSLHRTHIYDGSFQSSGAGQQSNNLCRTPLAQTDMYFVTFGSCNPTQLSHLFSLVDTYYPTVLLADTVCTHSHALLLLVQLTKLVTTAHEQCAMTRGSCWKHNFCQFERGVRCRYI